MRTANPDTIQASTSLTIISLGRVGLAKCLIPSTPGIDVAVRHLEFCELQTVNSEAIAVQLLGRCAQS